MKEQSKEPEVTEYIMPMRSIDGEDWIRKIDHDNLIAQEREKEREKAGHEIQRYRDALDYIALLANIRKPHLGRPRSSDTNCIFCLAYLALNDGAYGEHFDYARLAAERRAALTPTDPTTSV